MAVFLAPASSGKSSLKYQRPLRKSPAPSPEKKKTFRAALLNPPRQGCSSSLLKTIIEADVPHLIYVSCNPATLSRNLKILAEGGYRPGPVQPLDMFPQTHHVECIAVLERRKIPNYLSFPSMF